MKKILFVTYGGGHVHMICPVIHELRQISNYDVYVLALPAAIKHIQNAGIPFITFKDFLEGDAEAMRWGEELAEIHHMDSSGIDYQESVAYLGLNYKDLVALHGAEQAKKEMQKRGRQAFFPLGTMAKIFDKIKPDFVVTTNSPRSEAAAIEVANQRNINNLIITDLFTGIGYYKLKGKNITFLNKSTQKKFIDDGLVNPKISKLYNTGNPAFDKLIGVYQNGFFHAWSDAFPFVKNKDVVLHADTHSYWDDKNKCSYFKSAEETREELDQCYTAVTKQGAYYFVRPHPSQDINFYKKWIQDKKDAYLADQCDLHFLLSGIKLLLVRTSTVALEALFLRKRVLQIEYEKHNDVPLKKLKVSWGTQSYECLEQELKDALNNKKSWTEIKRLMEINFPHSKAAEQIAALIQRKINKPE